MSGASAWDDVFWAMKRVSFAVEGSRRSKPVKSRQQQTRTKYIKHGKNPIVAEGGRVDATDKHGEEHFADLERE